MLEGKLAEFSLQDIFQLLALTKKSGELRVAGSAEGRVCFRHGEVHFAVADVTRSPIAARLIHAGVVDEPRLRAVLAAQRDAGRGGFGRALVAAGILDDATLDGIVRDQIADAVADLLALEDGSFSFAPGDDADGAVGLTLSTEAIVTGAADRLAQWGAIRAQVPADDLVLAMATRLPQEEHQVGLDAEQWRVLTLVDGHRSVGDVVELTGTGRFTTCRVLASLVEAGLVEAVTADSAASSALRTLLARRDLLRRLEAAELGAAPAAHAVPPAAAPPPPAPAVTSPLEAPVPDAPAVEVPTAPAADVPAPAAEAGVAAESAPPAAPASPGDRAQVARELAALGLDGTAAPVPKRAAAPRPLTRDEDVNKGLLLRLIDGVKGA